MRAISLCFGIGVLLFGAGAVRAQALFACVTTKTGSIRMVASLAQCNLTRETPVSWNIGLGPGPPGEQGPPGVDGADGADGTSGSLFGGNYGNTADGDFLSPFNPSAGPEANTNLPVSSGTASKLLVLLDGPLGGGESVTLTLRKNAVDTALTCTVGTGSSTCTDLVHSVSFVDGAQLSIRYNEASSNTRVRFTILYQAP